MVNSFYKNGGSKSSSAKRYVGIIFFDVIVTLMILSLINYNGFNVWTWTKTNQLTKRVTNSFTARGLIELDAATPSRFSDAYFPSQNLSEDFLFGDEFINIYHDKDADKTDENDDDMTDASSFLFTVNPAENPSDEWHIDWRYLQTLLSQTTEFLQINELANEPTPLLDLDKVDRRRLARSVTWNNPNYVGHCRPYFFPQVAGVHWKHENGLQRVVNVLSELRAQSGQADNNAKARYSTDDEIVSLLNYQINNNNNQLRPWVYHAFDFYNSSNKEFNKKTNLMKLKASIARRGAAEPPAPSTFQFSGEYRSDHDRVEYMQELRTAYRFDSLVLTHNPKRDRYNLEIVVATNRPQSSEWKNHYERDIPLNKNTEGVRRWVGDWDDEIGEYYLPPFERIDSGMQDNMYLCVFSNGVTVLSNKIRRANDIKYFVSHYVIECDITDHPSILNPLLANQHSNVDTQLGLSLFSLLYKESDKQLYNEYLVAMNVQLPVCSVLEANRRKAGVYQNSLQYHAHSSQHVHRVTPHSVLAQEDAPPPRSQLYAPDGTGLSQEELFRNVQVAGVKNNLAAMTMLHPGLRSGRMELLVQQWIDYHLFQGFNHFYLFDHLMNRNEDDINTFDDALAAYINANIVTLFEWPHVVREFEHRDYEVSAYNDGIRRFRYDTKWLTLFDVDEWMVVLPKYAPGFEYDWNETPNVAALMHASNQNFGSQVLLAYQAIADFYRDEGDSSEPVQEAAAAAGPFFNEDIGCGAEKRFDTFFERTSCLAYSIDNLELIDRYFDVYKHQFNVSKQYRKPLDMFTKWDKLDVIRRGMSNLDVVKTRKRLQNDFGKWLHAKESLVNLEHLNDPSLSPAERREGKRLLYFDYLNDDQWWLGFSITPKVMVNPMLAYLGFQHDMNLYNTHALLDEKYFNDPYVRARYVNDTEEMQQYRKQTYHTVDQMLAGRHSDESGNLIRDLLTDNWDPPMWSEANNDDDNHLAKNYKVALVHTTDHWRTLGFYYRQNKVIDFQSKEDMGVFYNIIHGKCPSQGEILFWSRKFLMSKFGESWRRKRHVPPLFDEYGRFCYDLNTTYKQVWRDENGR